MKQTHKLLAVALSIVMILSVMSVIPFTASAETEGIFTYEVSDGEATITGLVDEEYSGAIEIPSTIGGYPVTSIGDGAFGYCSGLTSIIIPDSVTSIGDNAFYYCSGIETITIPDSVTQINNTAFRYCWGIGSIEVESGNTVYNSVGNCIIETQSKTLVVGCKNSVIPTDNSVTSIGNFAFSGCSDLISIQIPDSVISIGLRAFEDCSRLEFITIGNSVSLIDIYAFAWCPLIKTISIPNSVTSIGNAAFVDCSGITNIAIPNSVTSIGEYAFGGCTAVEKITVEGGNTVYHSDGDCIIETKSKALVVGCKNSVIPTDGSVTSIGNYAFSYCSELKSIDVPNSVTSIGGWAFYDCQGLKSITISNSVTSIGNYAFSNCRGLKNVYYTGTEQEKENIKIGSNNSYLHNATWHYSYGAIPGEEIFRYEVINGEATINGLVDGNYSGAIKIPSTVGGYPVTKIREFAFYNKSGLTSVTIPDSVISIGEDAFNNCTGLTTITIPDSVTSIGDFAFENCTGLTSVKIGNSVTSIGAAAFWCCESLESITIPNSVKQIGRCAFGYCSKLKSIEIPSSVNSIGDGAFEFCYELTSVKISGLVTAISDYAFFDCPGLETVAIPDSVTSIGGQAFCGCGALKSITIPNGVTSIGDGAFNGCSGLENITVKSGNRFYSSNGNCLIDTESKTLIVGCKNSIIPKDGSVTSISDSAFSGCEGLTLITIPDSVTSIGMGAFWLCKNLEIITVESGNPVYSSNGNCLIEAESKALIVGCKNSIIPTDGSVTSIGDYAFSGCEELKSITIPNGVKSIGDWAFENCAGLKSITISNSVKSIGEGAFYNCANIENITVASDNPVYSSKGNCLIKTNSKTLIIGCKNSVIPTDGSVTSIDDSAFFGCQGLTKVTIPDSVTSVGYCAFFGCTGLTSITIPNSVKSIGGSTFGDCTGLKSIVIPNSVTVILDYAFSGCTELTDVYYIGTEQEKARIVIESDNDELLNATWHYNYVPPCEHSVKICKTVKKATFTETGLKQEICTKCGEVLDEEVIPVLTETYSLETAKVNEAENISVAVSEGSNLPETAEIVVQKAEVTESSITYDIHIENEGIEVQPGAPVLVKVPIPAGFDKSKLNVFRKEQDGSKTRMEIVIDGDYAYFETDHFSIYEIIEKLCGDINGDDKVNNKDLTRLFQKLSGWSVETSEAALDINGDGKVNNKDLTRLFQYLSGWAVEIY